MYTIHLCLIYFGEFLWFVGVRILITSHPGYNRRDFFERSLDIFEGAPIWLNVFMISQKKCKYNLRTLVY